MHRHLQTEEDILTYYLSTKVSQLVCRRRRTRFCFTRSLTPIPIPIYLCIFPHTPKQFHCEWTAVLSSVAKKGAYKNMPTVLTGSSIRSAIETEFDIVETQAGAFGKTPASMTSRVMNFVMPEPPENRARKLSTATGFEAMAGDMSAMADGLDAVRLRAEGIFYIGIVGVIPSNRGHQSPPPSFFHQVYTEYTVTYKGKGYNPWYVNCGGNMAKRDSFTHTYAHIYTHTHNEHRYMKA